MSAVWITRRPDGSIYAVHDKDLTGGGHLALGWTHTRETLLTPEQAAVLEAAEAFFHDKKASAYELERALEVAVAALRAQEGA